MNKNQQWFIFDLLNGGVGPAPPPTDEFRIICEETQELRIICEDTQEARIT